MVRRAMAVVTAIVLFGEAVGVVLVNAVLATVVDNQQMSLAGMDPGAMSTGTWALGWVSGVLLVLCGLIPLVAAVRDRGPGRFARISLIGCAVVHGVLGALAVGLVGWAAFAVMMVVLGLLVLTLVSYAPSGPDAVPADTGGRGDGAGAGAPATV
ncbi:MULTISPECIES: hypothetical protein [unclassified Streptomyces]|uniref:hypothetical protein n=1 Tax=unclassified Streptomyces TaxID=2593676 RepID=UPI000CD58FFB|nr:MULTISPECIES: hypothetical protein [unclassified Streptomyces]AWL42915.1 hypothetical protein B9S64_21000 [Streptomyces sp. SM18]